MKYYHLLILCLCTGFLGFSQEKKSKADVMSTVICECLENKSSEEIADFQNTLDDCYKGSVLAALISGIDKAKKETKISLNVDGTSDAITDEDNEATLAKLNAECEVFQNGLESYQATDEKVLAVSEASCNCIATIPTNLETEAKNKGVQDCIASSVSQLREELDIDISTVEEIRGFYGEVYDYLVDNCEALSVVIFSDDAEKLNSYSSNDKAVRFYNQGQDYALDKKYKKAIKFYEKAVKEDPQFVFAWDNLGRSYREINELDKAIAAYKKSIAVDSLNRTSLMNIAVAYNYKKEYSNSQYWYTKLIDINDQDPEGHYGIALSFLYQNKIQEALESIIQAHKLYKAMGSPYVADAKKVMSYLKQFFEEANRLKEFKNTLKENNISLE